MVILGPQTGISAKKYPRCAEWDRLCRKNYATYQELIDCKTYAIQRARRSWFGSFFIAQYLALYQEDIYEVKLLKNKQMVGQILQEEVNIYKSVEPNIVEYVNRVFTIRNIDFPLVGFLTGLSLLGFARFFKGSYMVQGFVFANPVLCDYVYHKKMFGDSVITNEFLEWIIEYRKNRCFMELNRGLFQTKEAQKVLGDRNVVELGQELVKLVLQRS